MHGPAVAIARLRSTARVAAIGELAESVSESPFNVNHHGRFPAPLGSGLLDFENRVGLVGSW